MQDENSVLSPPKRAPWNKGKLSGAKPPLLARHVWSIRTKLQIDERRTGIVCCAGSCRHAANRIPGHRLRSGGQRTCWTC
jgi:hypothetical protein